VSFSVETLIEECQVALVEDDSQGAIREVLRRLLRRPDEVAGLLGRAEGGAEILYASEALTILNALWPPRIKLYPHDHRMVATIGVYAGFEANTFYRRTADRLEESGRRMLETADVFTLGRDAIHAVENPTDRWTGGVHVYTGDFLHIKRSQWNPETLAEEPYDFDQVRRVFVCAEEDWRRTDPKHSSFA
jgi:predicted metal-dependent enzyme (double-stranded beta helix superfamily)